MVVDLIFKEKSQFIIRKGMILNINCLHLYKHKGYWLTLRLHCPDASLDHMTFHALHLAMNAARNHSFT